MWCGNVCFTMADEIFSLTKLQEDEEIDLTRVDNKQRHRRDRNGDHLLVPFQCGLYHFSQLNEERSWSVGGRCQADCIDQLCILGCLLNKRTGYSNRD